jgi:flagellar hook-length control protein FliK
MRRGALSAVLRVDSREALDALRHHAPELRAAFEDANLDVGDLAFELDSGERDAQRETQQRSNAPDGGRERARRTELLVETPTRGPSRAPGTHRIDTLA